MNCNCPQQSDIIPIVDRIIQRIGTSKECAVPLLQAIQGEFNYLPSEAIKHICETTQITMAQLISVSTFYSQFRHLPSGEHTIKVCTGTACHVKGASNVYDALIRHLAIPQGTTTSEDMLFSIEKIACLGCCTLAPVVQIDGKTYGHVAPGRVNEMVTDFLESHLTQKQTTTSKEYDTLEGEIRLGTGSCCMASGSAAILEQLESDSAELGIKVNIKSVGCVGVCNKVPLIDIVNENGTITRYPKVKAEEIKEILLAHFQTKNRFRRLKNSLLNKIDNIHSNQTWDNVVHHDQSQRTETINNFLKLQRHISTEGYGVLSPLDIDEYISHGGFEALGKITSPAQVVLQVLESGIRGRGGGGFPTGKKWEIMAAQNADHKYIICNGDEGDPGAFMDRMLLESYPFRIIEGMLIAAFAVGASEGIFYIRAEYPLAVSRINRALEICRERKILTIPVRVFEGAGAFVCGEETALIASIEGERGFPRQRPPFPAVKGLNHSPTLVNNVETLSQIPYIIRHTAVEYRKIGTPGSSGTKVFALAGKIRNGGLIEVPMGVTMNQIVHDIGGGVEHDKRFKAVQVGGPSGGCIPAELCDLAVDFDAFNALGAMMGSGGLVVLDDQDCMVDMARYFLRFTCEESCGKCTFCRIGIQRMLDILNKLCDGTGTMEDIDQLETLALQIKQSSLCGLGRTAPNPVLTTLKYFRSEYEAHTRGCCPAGACEALTHLQINDSCIGCTKCAKVCAVDAIEYKPYEIHRIDITKCTLCGLCLDECSYQAIDRVSKPSSRDH